VVHPFTLERTLLRLCLTVVGAASEVFWGCGPAAAHCSTLCSCLARDSSLSGRQSARSLCDSWRFCGACWSAPSTTSGPFEALARLEGAFGMIESAPTPLFAAIRGYDARNTGFADTLPNPVWSGFATQLLAGWFCCAAESCGVAGSRETGVPDRRAPCKEQRLQQSVVTIDAFKVSCCINC
jgi:hypothetical protein